MIHKTMFVFGGLSIMEIGDIRLLFDVGDKNDVKLIKSRANCQPPGQHSLLLKKQSCQSWLR